MKDIQRLPVLGVPVDLVDMAGALEFIERQLRNGREPASIVAMNPEKVQATRANPDLTAFMSRASLLIPDGIGVALAVRLLHHVHCPRVPGCELMVAACEQAALKGNRIFIHGAKEDVCVKAVKEIERRYPDIQIVGHHHGYVPAEQEESVIDRINKSGAEILFLGLGSPKQELWMSRHLDKLNTRICQSVGGTLDIIAGARKRAPKLFCAVGLEWLYRLLRHPSRAKRQKELPVFAMNVLKACLTNRRQAE